MEKPTRRLSLVQILGIALVAIVASAVASYSVERFALHKPDPKVNVAVILGSTVPVLILLMRSRRGSDDKPPV
jgi:hypothetical protein